MPASVGGMDDTTRAKVVTALTEARDLISKRGYQPEWGKGGDSPLNLSNALTLACKDYETYILARQSFSKNWGGPEPGLLYWETYKRHTKGDALELLASVIGLLETGEANPTYKTTNSRAL